MTVYRSAVGLSRLFSGGSHASPPPVALWIPAAVAAALVLLPLIYLVLRTSSMGAEAARLLVSGRSIQLLAQTFALAGVVTAAAVVVGVPLAWLTTRTDLPFRRVWAVLLVVPLVIPTYVGAFAYVAAIGPRGLLQQVLAPLGVQRLPEIYGFWGAALVLALLTYPYVMLTVRAALLRLDPALLEVSRSLGVGPWGTFFRVTLFLLRPAIAAGALLVALYTLSDFGAVSLLQFDSFTRAIYLQYQGSLDRSAAAVLALLLVASAGAVVAFEAMTRGRARYHRSGSPFGEAPVVHLGRLRWLALGFCAGVLVPALILPLGVLLYWLARGVGSGAQFGPVGMAVASSAYASGLAAVATLLAAAPIAILAVRHPGRISGLLERVTYLAFALPGIVVALALVFFGANYASLLYQTLGLLTLGYGIRFLPEAVGALRAGLLQVSPHLEEAARSLGRRPHEVLGTVTLPLMGPSVMAGAALVFMSTMKELPVTLLLSPIGFKTLATTSWHAAAEASFAQAALPALLIVLVSAASVVFVMPSGAREEPERPHE